jgi:hypothetical protein
MKSFFSEIFGGNKWVIFLIPITVAILACVLMGCSCQVKRPNETGFILVSK